MEIRTDLTNEQYHAHPAISRSMIMDFIKLPQLCYYKYINPATKSESTAPMDFGTALHSAILEPDDFEATYIEHVKYTGTGSQALNKEFIAKSHKNKKKLLLPEDIEKIEFMKKNFNDCTYAAEKLKGACIEQSIFWTDEETGLDVKVRPDFSFNGVGCDLKTTRSIEPADFSKSMYEFGYHVQAAMVLDALTISTGVPHDVFIIFAFENSAPYCMAPLFVSEEALEIGRARYRKALIEMKACFDNPVMWTMPREIGLPTWATQKEQGELNYDY
jgi:hypothetical protein